MGGDRGAGSRSGDGRTSGDRRASSARTFGPVHEPVAKSVMIKAVRPGREDFMFARRLAGLSFVARASLLMAIVVPGSACVGTDVGVRPASWIMKPEEPI